MINPHIPEYMSKAPWYLNQEEGAGLKHQKAKEKAAFDGLGAWYVHATGRRTTQRAFHPHE